jgi:putative transposase
VRYSKKHEKTTSFLEEEIIMDQITHDVRRTNWLNIITQCQERPAGISAKQWLSDNGIHEKTYYYWLRKFRKEAYAQMQVSAITQTSDVSFAEISMPDEMSPVKPVLTTDTETSRPAAVIKCNGITIEISNDISASLLTNLLREVSHA